MNSVKRVAKRTRERRVKHGLSRQALTELADVREKFLQEVEAGRKKEIWVSTVERIAAALCLELNEFFAREVPAGSTLAKKVVSSRVHRR